ncbi:DUF4179 domain-containing protein [Paenibacillus wulumuqiensis]|uniref:DUF4179 domain-containing protein n=1 Tax=Paenibacillus wulumuqiensis TaxID=1567107 RepID=UPI00061992EF|nr:DUF4179 domain-containing protein [Paenibacillus wulumuqiensis]
MKPIEDVLKQQVAKEELTYPDFDHMWTRMEANQPPAAGSRPVQDISLPSLPKEKAPWEKALFIASLSLLVAAVPVYAAIQIDWSRVLHYRSGIQSALTQQLGQPVEQSVTQSGVTMTIHTAIVDDNRTVFLYSLDPGRKTAQHFGFLQMKLTDAQGKDIPGLTMQQQWDEASQRFTGYLETGWTPPSNTLSVHLSLENLQFLQSDKQTLDLDSQTEQLQRFDIQQNGLDQMEVQIIPQGQEQTLVRSALSFTNEEARAWSYPQLHLYTAEGTPVQPSHSGTYGVPDEQGRYTAQDYYLPDDLEQTGLLYQLEYTKEVQRFADHWDFDIALDKRQMGSSTIQQPLSIPLGSDNTDIQLTHIVISPTQIRIRLSESNPDSVLPFTKYDLLADGKALPGYAEISPDTHRHASGTFTLIFERPQGININNDTALILRAQHQIIAHHGDHLSVNLPDITEQRKSLQTRINGFAVNWTYYRQDGHLYIQTESNDVHFGGISQTSIFHNGEQMFGQPLTVNALGDGNNKNIEVYRHFTGSSAKVNILFYTEENPEQITEAAIPLAASAFRQP